MDILKKHGLSITILKKLSYKSNLGIRLKKNLHYFDKESLMTEIRDMQDWYDKAEYLHQANVNYRVKSLQSANLKYERYFPDHQTGKVFNDILGFRILCDNYGEARALGNVQHFRIADMSSGKANDDGYRGIHIYFQLSPYHYPIELQCNTYYDRQLNNWLHKYLYKKDYSPNIGKQLRKLYENGKIKTELEFKEVLKNVLYRCKEN